MTEERDADIQALFKGAEEDLPGENFVAGVVAGVRKSTRLRTALFVVAIVAMLSLAWLLAEPLQEAAMALERGLMARLVELPDGFAAQMLAPINSVAGLIAFVLLLMRSVLRKIVPRAGQRLH